jgi:hypothetical protein
MEGIRSVSDAGGHGISVKCEGGVAGADVDRDEVAATMTPCPVEVAHGYGGAMAGGEERGHKMDVDKGVDAAIQPKSVSLPKGHYGTEGFV